MVIIAHRGASGLEPENTLRSFKRAEEIGVDMIELDIRQSEDDELVVIHDASLKRLFGLDKLVAFTTLAELKSISIAAGREIPTLDEVLAEIHQDLDLDIKVHGIEKLLLSKLQNFSHKVLISSIYPGVLKKIRALDENVRLGLILGRGEFHLLPILNRLTKKLDLYSIHPKYVLVYSATLAIIRQTKRKVFVWTVNENQEFDRVHKLGVDGVITDSPQIYKQYEQDRSI